MKKIMFTLAIGLIVASVQANAVKWELTTTASSTYYGTSADLSTYTAYLVQESDWTGKLADLENAVAQASWATSKDTGTARQYKTGSVESTTTLATGDKSFYIVLSDGSNYWASDAKTATVYEAGSTDPNNKAITIQLSGASAITTASLQSFSGGGSGGVPEPTSGLLLLVGGAMLALRRKQK